MALLHLHQRKFETAAAALVPLLALVLSACGAATKPPETGRPRAGGVPYPVTLAASEERRQGAIAAWATIVSAQATPQPTPELRPVTATLVSLPANLAAPVRMPKVVIQDENELSEEEIRESLRRFISTAAPLLGVSTGELSLVGVTEVAGSPNVRRALYRQNPFLHPLRNGYGDVEVVFTTPDLVVTGLSSTAVPDAERLRRALSAVTQQVNAQAASSSLANRAVVFRDRAGVEQTRTIAAAEQVSARELVVFPVRAASDPATLELRLAWELAAGTPTAPLLVYVDAVTGEQLGAAEGAPAG
ncbi:MAG TPA: hypothetical protein VGX48_01055 [Pyrinomonadaceae bacterium]|jgi:hypothetical protein|nr:hypothetical protein [Pyrinomonadaceae bacterium]